MSSEFWEYVIIFALFNVVAGLFVLFPMLALVVIFILFSGPFP